ncbi:MAG TPA: FMN-binding protein [Candidatus Dormibacteraeota bacterium]
MKRAMSALVATVAGVVWVVTYKVSPPTSGLASVAKPRSSPPAAASPAPAPSPTGKSGTFTGQDEQTIYGDTQVQVVLVDGKITSVKTVQLPYDRPESQYISSVAGPQLQQEAVQAQSANIDVISGATYTSEAFAASLQDALHQAGLD